MLRAPFCANAASSLLVATEIGSILRWPKTSEMDLPGGRRQGSGSMQPCKVTLAQRRLQKGDNVKRVLITGGSGMLGASLSCAWRHRYQVFSTGRTPKEQLVYFLTIDKAKFRKPVIPGDTIEYHMTKIAKRKTMWWFRGEARVAGVVVAEAEVGAMIATA